MGTSLKICIYMIRLSSLLGLDIYFPLKPMFDYTLLKDKVAPSWLGLTQSCPVVSLGFRVIKKMRRTKYKNYSAVANKDTDEDDLLKESKEINSVK